MRSKFIFILSILIFVSSIVSSYSTSADTGPCRRIENKKVCMPAPQPTGGGGGCGCYYCKINGDINEYTYADMNCDEWEQNCGGEGCTQGPCKHWGCSDRRGQCFSEPNGVTHTSCPIGSNGQPDPDKCNDPSNIPPGYRLCTDVYDEGLHAAYCKTAKDEFCRDVCHGNCSY
jgi:hypothetical protein